MKYFLAAFGPDPAALDAAVRELAARHLAGNLGEVDFQSPDYPVSETDYYRGEMGGNLRKRYLTFKNLLFPDHLVFLKILAMRVEEETRGPSGGRLVNLDPGYIFQGGLVLSTAKFSGHRIYIGRGLWAELTLHYHRGAFEAQPWTYQDYKKPELTALFNEMRRSYLADAGPR